MWYAVYTAPRKEAAASAYLSEFDLEIVCPTVLSTRRVRRRGSYVIVTSQVPAFPCYLFVKSSPLLFKILHADTPDKIGKLKVIGARGYPSPLDDSIVESLRNIGDYVDDVDLRRLRAGSLVQIGTLAGLIGTIADVTSLAEQKGVSVWIEMLGKRKAIQVSAADLVAA